jgi:membrane protein implicated in regulation of membrane protease activity
MMLMTAIAWIYVVGLMALTEPSVVAGLMTFLLYCVLPLSILFYLTGSRRRKRKRQRQAETDDKTKTADT